MKGNTAKREEKARIPVPEGVCYYVRSLYYDRDGLRLLNTHMARTEGYDKARRREYLKRYMETNREYMTAFDEMCKEYAGAYLGGGFEFELSFLTEEIVVWRRV